MRIPAPCVAALPPSVRGESVAHALLFLRPQSCITVIRNVSAGDGSNHKASSVLFDEKVKYRTQTCRKGGIHGE